MHLGRRAAKLPVTRAHFSPKLPQFRLLFVSSYGPPSARGYTVYFAILANTDSVGKHVCTWVQTNAAGYTVRTNLYNKVVSNFEVGDVREPIGRHLADYVDCPNQHLHSTFLYPDVQARGCARIEVSLYACRRRELSADTASEVVSKALALVSPQRERLFVVQTPTEQCKNLAACLDRCLVLADGPQGSIFVAWYAHTETERVSGIWVWPTKANADNDAV